MGHPNPGSRVSHYQLVRKLGSGGMGDVFLARDLQLERPVAIKFLNAPTDEHSRHRLLKEAKAAASLDHPFICAVYEVGSDEASGDFIVMQYVEGETLAARLSRGALTPDDTLTLAGEVAEALAAAHQHGIVHRDLKPLNIVMQPSGRPKLLDFGISKRVASPHEAAEAATETQLTGPHGMVGTPGYMAPEQVQGKPADFRSDLFALGCVLYECLTGRRAFAGVTSGEVFGEVLHKDPPPASSLRPGVTPEMDAFISRLLRKSPGERFQSADEVLGALRTLRGQTTGSGQRWSSSGTSTGVLPGRPSRLLTIAAVAVVLVVAAAAVAWWRAGALPPAPPDAERWYADGVEGLRNGTYATARAALEEAVRVFPDYAQAYSRLAEAYMELDDDGAAQRALLRVTDIVPNVGRLATDDRLRLEAVRAMVLREHEQAIAAYSALRDRHAEDAGLWLDLGRAQEAAGRNGAALEHYAQAVALDGQYAAAQLRMGVAAGQAGEPARALAAFDEAIRLYRAASRTEGEAEALLRKGIRQSGTGDFSGARTSLERAIAITSQPQNLYQNVRSRFELARVTLAQGQFEASEKMAADAVAEASAAGLDRFAADGLIDLANALSARGRYTEADAALERAAELAKGKGAKRTEMRARLQQASLRHQTNRPEEAIALADAPLRFFAEGRYRLLEAQARNIVSRGRESLEEYEEAQKLAREALQYAESIGNTSLMAESLDNLAGQATKLGRLPEALRHRARGEQIHRDNGEHAALKFDLPNRAELLIRLGRGRDAETLLGEVDQAIANGVPAYLDRGRRLATLRAMLASIEGRWAEAESHANAADPGETPSSSTLTPWVLREHARARLGTSRVAPDVIAGWLGLTTSPITRRELAYWVAQTLLARKAPALALEVVARELWTEPLEGNLELRWRLASLALQAIRAGATAPEGAGDFDRRIDDDVQRLDAEWGADATSYFARPDLSALRKSIQGASDAQ